MTDEKRALPRVRIETGDSWIFTRTYIDGVELKGVRRIAFDSGDPDGPKWPVRGDHRTFHEPVRVFVEFYASDLFLEGPARVETQEVRPKMEERA